MGGPSLLTGALRILQVQDRWLSKGTSSSTPSFSQPEADVAPPYGFAPPRLPTPPKAARPQSAGPAAHALGHGSCTALGCRGLPASPAALPPAPWLSLARALARAGAQSAGRPPGRPMGSARAQAPACILQPSQLPSMFSCLLNLLLCSDGLTCASACAWACSHLMRSRRAPPGPERAQGPEGILHSQQPLPNPVMMRKLLACTDQSAIAAGCARLFALEHVFSLYLSHTCR